MTSSGFVALAGRPNVGKSTLVNAVVGRKVAIVSDRPQTTRRAIRGVATTDSWQMVLVDLPGVQRPRDALTSRMQHRVERELADCDVALLVLDGAAGIGPGDRFIARLLSSSPVPVILAVNKIDRLDRPGTVLALQAAAELGVGDEVFPVSARTGSGVQALVSELAGRLPPGPFLFPTSQASDQPRERMLAELVREQILPRTFQEIPHAVEVVVEDVESPRPDLTVVRAVVWVETESQKGILVGAGGAMVKAIGSAARPELERELGTRVHLELSVRVRRRWRTDEALLDRLEIDRPARASGSSDSPQPRILHMETATLEDGSEVAFDENGLVVCVIQDWRTGEVLTVAYMNAESLARTRETGEVHLWSRSRQELWHKGQTSGNTQRLRALRVDCDGDAVLALVEPSGPACHTGERTCFHRGTLDPPAPFEVLPGLERVIAERDAQRPAGSYTARLLGDPSLAGEKVEEEAAEVVAASRQESDLRVDEEAADVLYHLAVLLRSRGRALADAAEVLSGRRR